jgi:hypothetical protein
VREALWRVSPFNTPRTVSVSFNAPKALLYLRLGSILLEHVRAIILRHRNILQRLGKCDRIGRYRDCGRDLFNEMSQIFLLAVTWL